MHPLTRSLVASALLALPACETQLLPPDSANIHTLADLAQLAPGWSGEIVATVDQSYAGWDVEIGDIEGDGKPEILTGTAPDSRLLVHRKRDGIWQTTTLMDRAAQTRPAMVLGVRVVDLDHDGVPEILAGTGQEDESTAWLHVLHTDGQQVTSLRSLQAPANTSSYTHGLPTADLDGDGVDEIVSAYCGHGEVIRYDVTKGIESLESRKVLQLSGSGEDSWIVDVDADGKKELLVSNGFRDGKARIEIHDFDPTSGDPLVTPRLVLDGFEGKAAFYASLAAGDLDDDGRPELLVGWKMEQDVNRATLVAYRIDGVDASVAYVLTRDDPDLDLGYFEKMIGIGDLDRDGRTEIVVSTRGDGTSEGIDSLGLGHVLVFRVEADGSVSRQQLVDFNTHVVGASWLAVGDADGDGRQELVLATGIGDRTQPGTSWVLAIHHN